MATFIATLLLFAGLLLVISIPILAVAWRRRRIKTARRFLIAAGITALFCATVSAGSTGLVEQCEAAGNTNCLDAGAAGIQLLALGGYAITSWVAAVIVYRD